MTKPPEAGEPREIFISVRGLPVEKERAQSMAAEDGTGLSRFVRRLINAEWIRRKGSAAGGPEVKP